MKKLNKNNFNIDALFLEENKTNIEEKIKTKDDKTNNGFLIDINELGKLKNEFDKFKDFDKLQNFNSNKKAINLKYMNIVDPMFPTNNLGKSVNFHNFSKIKKVFEYAAKEVDLIINSRNFIDPYNYLTMLLKLFNKTVTINNSELFYFTLPQPKIIITPKNLEIEQNESNNKNISNNNSDLINSFNKMFVSNTNNNNSITNNNNEEISLNNNILSSNNCNGSSPGNDVKNTLNNLIWPSNYKVEDNNEKNNLINYYKNMNNINYATKEILEFVMKNSETNKSYNFQSYQDFSSIHTFLKNINI